MNIFYLSKNPTRCAQYHVDKHVVKMIVEYAQLMSTAHVLLDDNQVAYKATHKNHPSAVWTRQSKHNYEWLFNLWSELCEEYTLRYYRMHKTEGHKKALSVPPTDIPTLEFTQPTQAMPPEFKHENSLIAYRNYYKVAKEHLHSWKGRDIPYWIDKV